MKKNTHIPIQKSNWLKFVIWILKTKTSTTQNCLTKINFFIFILNFNQFLLILLKKLCFLNFKLRFLFSFLFFFLFFIIRSVSVASTYYLLNTCLWLLFLFLIDSMQQQQQQQKSKSSLQQQQKIERKKKRRWKNYS